MTLGVENMEVVRRRYVFRNTFGRLLEVEIYNSRMGQVFSRQAGDILVMSLGSLDEKSCDALDMYCDKFPNHTLIACV